jgi:hypothetical protein
MRLLDVGFVRAPMEEKTDAIAEDDKGTLGYSKSSQMANSNCHEEKHCSNNGEPLRASLADTSYGRIFF